jgi:uncharacterized membrane protein YkvA (DUF1232 family)
LGRAVFKKLREWKRTAKRDALVSWLALRDARAPWYVKAVAAAAALYAISPIDIIPDLIPFHGLLDDVVVIPLAIAMMVRLIPIPLRDELTQKADARIAAKRPRSRVPEAIIIICVVGIAVVVAWLIWFR